MFRRWSKANKRVRDTLERAQNEAPLELERGDLKAIIIAALLAFIPIIVGLGGMMFLLYWLFVGRF